MKKLSVVVVFIFLLFSMAACGGSDDPPGTSPSTDPSLADDLFDYDDFATDTTNTAGTWVVAGPGNTWINWDAAGYVALNADNTSTLTQLVGQLIIDNAGWPLMTAVAADFKMATYDDVLQTSNGRWFLSFYNDNTSGSAGVASALDDVFVTLELYDTFVTYAVQRCNDAGCTATTALKTKTNLATGLTVGKTYTLFVGWDGATTFTFQVDNKTAVTFDASTMGSNWASLPYLLNKRIEIVAEAGSSTFFQLQIDNVRTSTVWP